MASLRIGTRGSPLARAQATQVAELLAAHLPSTEVHTVVIGVSGDTRSPGGSPIAGTPPDKARWVDRIEEALTHGSIDLAVHSAKDVPGQLAPGLALLGAPPRLDPRDALCGASSLAALAPGARVGTASVRRAAQLLALRQDIEIVELRGNVDTRLRRLRDGAYDAIVLALAGLLRLGRDDVAATPLDLDAHVPSPGQGTLALEGREEDVMAASAARAISDPAAMAALAAERAVVRILQAGCATPVGAHARADGPGMLRLTAFAGLPDGSAWVRDRLQGSTENPRALGEAVGQRLLSAGADDLLLRAQEMADAAA